MADFQVVGARNRNREDMRTVAVYQKGIIICLLIQFLAVFGLIVLAAMLFSGPPIDRLRVIHTASPVVVLVLLAAGLVAMVFAFLLSLKVYSTVKGILLALLTLVPLLGLFVLLAVNGRATFILRQNGHKVGWLGASLSEIRYSLQADVDLASPHPNPLPEGEGAAKEPL